jgi:hypothetical protein
MFDHPHAPGGHHPEPTPAPPSETPATPAPAAETEKPVKPPKRTKWGK